MKLMNLSLGTMKTHCTQAYFFDLWLKNALQVKNIFVGFWLYGHSDLVPNRHNHKLTLELKYRTRLEVIETMDVKELDYVKIGERIREIRKERKWTQSELAYRAGINSSYLSHIETAKTKLSLPVIVQIANALSVSVDRLLCDSLEDAKHIFDDKIAKELADCDTAELQAFLEIIKTTKATFRKIRKDTTLY